MRPKSALFYIDDLADIVDELIAKLMADCNAQGETQNVAAACAQYGLEAIGKMFLGSNLGAIQVEAGLDFFELQWFTRNIFTF